MNELISFEQALEILKQIGEVGDTDKRYMLNTYRVGVESFNDEASFPGHCLHMSIGFVDRKVCEQAMKDLQPDKVRKEQEPSVLNLL